jgi:iron complex transport system substrate-binding protein
MATRTQRLILVTACVLVASGAPHGLTINARGGLFSTPPVAGLVVRAAGGQEVAPGTPRTRTSDAAVPARRIVSVVPALTELLFALGAGPQVVGVSSYDDGLPEVQSLPRVGALLNPDTERIFSLRPDLVIVYGSQLDLEARLARAGIRTYAYRHGDLAHVFDTIRDLALLVGRVRDGERLDERIREQLDTVRASVRGRPRPRTLLVFERDPGALRGLYVSGGRGFLHDLLELAGGVNVFADTDREAVQPSLETLLARAPEVIIEIRATGMLDTTDDAAARRAWSALSSIPAVKDARIHVLHGDHLVVPGPRVALAAEALARAIHP